MKKRLSSENISYYLNITLEEQKEVFQGDKNVNILVEMLISQVCAFTPTFTHFVNGLNDAELYTLKWFK